MKTFTAILATLLATTAASAAEPAKVCDEASQAVAKATHDIATAKRLLAQCWDPDDCNLADAFLRTARAARTAAMGLCTPSQPSPRLILLAASSASGSDVRQAVGDPRIVPAWSGDEPFAPEPTAEPDMLSSLLQHPGDSVTVTCTQGQAGAVQCTIVHDGRVLTGVGMTAEQAIAAAL